MQIIPLNLDSVLLFLHNSKVAYSRFKKSTRCHSFMALNKASDMSTADWLSQAHVKKYRYFSYVFSYISQWWKSL